jgi:hypothetical protein
MMVFLKEMLVKRQLQVYFHGCFIFIIFFLDPPTVQVQQSSYSVTTGNTVTLVCTVTSNLPVTNVYWQRNIGGSVTTITVSTNPNKYSGSTTTTPSITIFSVQQSDVGTYTCYGSNSVGTDQSSTTLSVTGSMYLMVIIAVICGIIVKLCKF